MLKPAVESCFDIVFWLLDRALDDGEYLQPQKMHRLMFLSQAYYASARHGGKLMPASFVVGPEGPIEPTVFRAMERGKPMVDTSPLDPESEHVMDSVWRQFGAKSVESLNAALKGHPPVALAVENGLGTEIGFDAMVEFYVKALSQNARKGPKNNGDSTVDAPTPDKVIRPKLMRSHTGKPVEVTGWAPRRVD